MTPNSSGTFPLAAFNPPRRSASGVVEPFKPSDAAAKLPKLAAYVDETGDRGRGPKASPIFGMAAVIVDPTAETAARAALNQLRTDFKVPPGTTLSWKDHIKKNHRRAVHAAKTFAAVPGIKVVFVVVNKSMLYPGTYGDDQTTFYNVTALSTLERILWAAKHWEGGSRQVAVRFGHVAKHDNLDTHRYFQLRRDKYDNSRVPYGLISNLKWVNASQYEMSQVADVYGGFLKEAFWPGDFDLLVGDHLLRVWHQIRNADSCVIHLGLMPKPQNAWATGMDWFPCANCTK